MSRVYTAADVEGLGEGVSRAGLVLAPGDVISPAALDVARELRIAVRWGDGADDGYGDGAGDGAGDGYGDGAGDAYGELGAAVGSSAGGGSAAGVAGELEQRILREVEEVLREVPGGSVDEVVDRALRRLAQRPVGVEGGTVTERLASFITGWAARGLPPEVTHEAKRLIINNLKASVRARDHDFVRILLARTEAIERGAEAHVLWHGTATSGEQAALINAVQMEVFDFNETHVPSYVHLSAPVLPAVLACGEAIGAHGGQLLDGLALGIEVELAVSTMLMPTAYERGFLPGVIAGTVGAAAGCASILRLSHSETCNAIAIAMLGAGGLFEAVGSMTASYLVANAARNGYVAAQLAARGVDAPTTAFEGEKGMLLGFSVADPGKIEGVMEGLGTTWRMRDGSYKRYQAETIDQAPLECLFTIRERTPAEKLASIAAMRFHVEPLVANIAKERYERFGKPGSDLQATFDLRYVMAAAWTTGRIGGDVYTERFYTDPTILDLRDRVDVVGGAEITLDGATLDVNFTDGTTDEVTIAAFTGSAMRPLPDGELEDLFRREAASSMSPERVEDILGLIWSIGEGVGVREVVGRLVVGR